MNEKEMKRKEDEKMKRNWKHINWSINQYQVWASLHFMLLKIEKKEHQKNHDHGKNKTKDKKPDVRQYLAWNDFEEQRLAGTGDAEYSQTFAVVDSERDPADRQLSLETLEDAVDHYDVLVHGVAFHQTIDPLSFLDHVVVRDAAGDWCLVISHVLLRP